MLKMLLRHADRLFASIDDVIPREACSDSDHTEYDRACYHSVDTDHYEDREVALRTIGLAMESVSGSERAGKSDRRGEKAGAVPGRSPCPKVRFRTDQLKELPFPLLADARVAAARSAASP